MILGAVLAGGRSRRFGSDKAAALLQGTALIEHVLARLAPQVDAILVCGRTLPGYPGIADRPAADLGPLGGLAAALRHGCDHGFATVVTVPCDAPLLNRDLVARLAPNAPAVAATMPVVGAWPASLADRLDAHLRDGDDRSMRRWARLCGAIELDLTPLANINTPEDLARLASGER